MTDRPSVTVLYDEDCGFCRWSADRIRRFGRRGALVFAPIQSEVAAELLRKVPAHLRLSAMHAVTPDGRVWSGGAAVRIILRQLPGASVTATLAEAFPGPTDRVYRLIATNRERLGGWLGQDACDVDPSTGRQVVRRMDRGTGDPSQRERTLPDP